MSIQSQSLRNQNRLSRSGLGLRSQTQAVLAGLVLGGAALTLPTDSAASNCEPSDPNFQGSISGLTVLNGCIPVSLTIAAPNGRGLVPDFGRLTIDQGALLTNNAQLDDLDILNNYGELINNGRFHSYDRGQLNNYGIVDNTASGQIDISSPTALWNKEGGTIKNSGYISNSSGIENFGLITNKLGGRLYNQNGMFNFDLGKIENFGSLGNNSYLQNSGTLNNKTGGELINNDGQLINTGHLTNDGAMSNTSYTSSSNAAIIDNQNNFVNNGQLSITYGTLQNEGVMTNNGFLSSGNDDGNPNTPPSPVSINNQGTFTNYGYVGINDKVDFHNDGVINNTGSLYFAGTGKLTGTGMLYNTGTGNVNVGDGSSVNVGYGNVMEPPFVGSKLTGGHWRVYSETGTAELYFGDGNSAIDTISLNTSVSLEGKGARIPQLEGHLTANYGQLAIYGGHVFKQALDLTNSGSLDLNGGELIIQSGATLTNSKLGPTSKLYNGSKLSIEAGGGVNNVNNDSYIVNAAGATLNNAGALNNSGLLNNLGQINNSGSFGVTGEIVGTGTVNQNDGTLTVNGTVEQAAINLNGGVLKGTGTIYGALNQNGGTLSPGNSPGTLTINGDFTFNSGILEIEIGGSGAGQSDVLNISGIANLGTNSVLEIHLLNDFTPSLGTKFDFLTASSITGQFGNFLLPTWTGMTFQTDFLSGPNGGYLQLTAVQVVPVPAAVWLFGSTIMGLGAFSWRRKAA